MLPPLCKRFMTRLNTCAPTLLPHPPHLWSKKEQQTPTKKQRTTNDKSKIWKPSIENKSVPPTNNNPTQPISHHTNNPTHRIATCDNVCKASPPAALATLILFAAATASLSMCFDMSGKSTEYPFIQVRSMWSVAGRKRGQNTLKCMVLPDRKPNTRPSSLTFPLPQILPLQRTAGHPTSSGQHGVLVPGTDQPKEIRLRHVPVNQKEKSSIKKRNRGHHGHPRTSNTRTKEELLN